MQYVSAAILIAGLAIAYYQWRTAQQKIAIDLFDARYKIYNDLKDIVVRFLQQINFTNELQQRYIEAQNRARFYFGAEIEAYLEATRLDILRGHYVDRIMNREIINVDEQVARLDRINAFYREIDKKFIPYMRFNQRMSLWWWPNPVVLLHQLKIDWLNRPRS